MSIPNLFLEDGLMNPSCAWVALGQGFATIDREGGVRCFIKDGVLFRAYLLRPDSGAPPGFFADDLLPADASGQPGFIPVETTDHVHLEARRNSAEAWPLRDGPYSISGDRPRSVLGRRDEMFEGCPRVDREALAALMRERGIQSIIWHHGPYEARVTLDQLPPPPPEPVKCFVCDGAKEVPVVVPCSHCDASGLEPLPPPVAEVVLTDDAPAPSAPPLVVLEAPGALPPAPEAKV